MNKRPKNPRYSSKNERLLIKDVSNNNPFLDMSRNKMKNPHIDPLHDWYNVKKSLLLRNKDNKNTDNRFIMRLDSIIDDVQTERKSNNLFKLKNTLVKPRPILYDKKSLDEILEEISVLYNLTNAEHYQPRIKSRRRDSVLCDPIVPPYHLTIQRVHKVIDCEINSLCDLIELIENNPLTPFVENNINMEAIHNIKEPLHELNNMIGMNGLKDSIVDQIIYFVQNLHINKDPTNSDFMHTCIYGPPGTGKTEIAKIIGKIFSSLGILKKKYFKKVTRTDLIAGYLGQTAMKTGDVIKEALGGVLFIDEAYALGNMEKRDSFAKECIDTLCEGLSDHKGQLMVIIAGYEADLKNCFFAYNQGLNSRFPWRFKTDDYKASELNQIFQKKIADIDWSLTEEIPDKWFEDKMDTFTFFGRDMETLLAKTKIAHGRRVFCKPKEEKMKLNMKDIEKGYVMFTDNNEVSDRNKKKNHIEHMYL